MIVPNELHVIESSLCEILLQYSHGVQSTCFLLVIGQKTNAQ